MTVRVPSRCLSHSRPLPVQPRQIAPKQGPASRARNTLDSRGVHQRISATFATHVRVASPASSQTQPLKKYIPQSLEWNARLQERAENLIFGSRLYHEFTLEEKDIVNFYQKKILEIDGGIVFPNTQADLDQQEVEKILRQTPLSRKR